MRTSILAILLWLTFPVFAQQKEWNWKHYNLFTAGIDLPDVFQGGKIVDEYNTYSFPNSVNKEISLSIECLVASPKFTASDLESYYSDCEHDFANIAYELLKKDYFVISGTGDKGQILYTKGIIKGSSYFAFHLTYPKKYQLIFDKTLPRISASFK